MKMMIVATPDQWNGCMNLMKLNMVPCSGSKRVSMSIVLSKVLVRMKKTGPTTSKEIPQKILGFVCFEDESDSKRLYLQPVDNADVNAKRKLVRGSNSYRKSEFS